MNVDRVSVLAVIRNIRDAMVADRAIGVVLMEDPRGCEIVRTACAERQMSVDAWVAALHADVELGRFFEQVLDELVVEQPDPGPYDIISRESPDGTLEDELVTVERPARPRGSARR